MANKDRAGEMAYKVKADFLKALAHPARLMVIEALKNGEKSVGALVRELGFEQPSLSRHLIALREAGILKSRQERTTVFYGIQDLEIFSVLRPVAVMLRKKFRESERVLATLGKD